MDFLQIKKRVVEEKLGRIPRKLKKKLKKNGTYRNGLSHWHCYVCQKRYNGHGYDALFCKNCWEKEG